MDQQDQQPETEPVEGVPQYEPTVEKPEGFLTPLQPSHFIMLALCFALIYQCTSIHRQQSKYANMLGRNAHIRAKVSRVKSDMRSLATGIEAYVVDHAHYPPPQREPALGRGEADGTSVTLVGKVPQSTTGALMNANGIVYMDRANFVDPFAPLKGAPFAYHARYPGWIIVSAGPDRDYDIDPPVHYDPTTSEPTPTLLHRTYDPTNGTVSDGDVWRIRQW